jgi:hypothetical protein
VGSTEYPCDKNSDKYQCIPLGSKYPSDNVHTMEALAAITPNDVLWYLNMSEIIWDNRASRRCKSEFDNANSLAMDKKHFHISCQIGKYGV